MDNCQELYNICNLGNHMENNCGTINIYGAYFDKKIPKEKLLVHILKIFNDAIQMSINYYNKDTFIVKADLSNVTFKNVDGDFLKQLTLILQSAYPEKLEKCLIHNPPAIFTSIWGILKKLIDK